MHNFHDDNEATLENERATDVEGLLTEDGKMGGFPGFEAVEH